MVPGVPEVGYLQLTFIPLDALGGAEALARVGIAFTFCPPSRKGVSGRTANDPGKRDVCWETSEIAPAQRSAAACGGCTRHLRRSPEPNSRCLRVRGLEDAGRDGPPR